jgi:NADH-quinone oxidoreductase subunit L
MSANLSLLPLVIVPVAPLVGAIVAGLFGQQIGRANAHRITILGVLISFVISAMTLNSVVNDGAHFSGTVYEWMNAGGLKMEVGFLIDGLTAMMMCVVTFVSLMVHIYTIGYMKEDPGYQRFFSYISLFTFSMLMLVMSNNFLQLFFGWEAVGLVSYLLIGFWFKKPTAIFANMKAFLVNRVGDFGFILGIGLIASYAHTLDYAEAFDAFTKVGGLATAGFGLGTDWLLITVTCICLFIGAMGKSAQFPLHVWLPDSMEGPTPISALIHAATMVTAGIFMVTRMSPLFELSDTALNFVLVIGSITALFMGILGIIQNDIKRVVAYSTLSQLGYMTVALGLSAYPVAVFHLMTHAFFKALLFLAAGSVIMGMHHDQDIRNMGGLRKYMKITYWTSLIGSLALIGTPFFSGFYSKDSIIDAAHASHLPGAGFAIFAVTASVFVTAFYSFRMFFLVFHGKERFHDKPFPPELDGPEPELEEDDSHGEHGHAVAHAAHAHDDHAHAHDAHGHGDHGHGHDDHDHTARVAVGRHRPADRAGHPVGGHRLLHDQADAVRQLLRQLDLLRHREASGDGRAGARVQERRGDGRTRLRLAAVLARRARRGDVVLVLHHQPGDSGGPRPCAVAADQDPGQQVLLRLVQRERPRRRRPTPWPRPVEGWRPGADRWPGRQWFGTSRRRVCRRRAPHTDRPPLLVRAGDDPGCVRSVDLAALALSPERRSLIKAGGEQE